MKSSLLALLLIVNLLTCPLRCLSCYASGDEGQQSAQAKCDCCTDCNKAPASSASEPGLPGPCEEDCDCQDCICKGAIIDAAAEWQIADCSVIWVTPAMLMVQPLVVYGNSQRRSFLNQHGRPFYGRDARIALQSLLI
jgi:hypothetical protein